MATTVSSVQHQSINPSKYQGHGCKGCKLFSVGVFGSAGCLMEAVKCLWEDPSVSCYCDEPSTMKFVNVINSRLLS